MLQDCGITVVWEGGGDESARKKAVQLGKSDAAVQIAVDNYQALYMPSSYGEWMNNNHRRILQPQELRVAASMRLLEQALIRDEVVVCAADRGGSSSGKLRVRASPRALFWWENVEWK